jgi:hypothetical protein
MQDIKLFVLVTEFYKQFLQKDVDVKSEAVLKGLAVAEQLRKLTEGEVLLTIATTNYYTIPL